jgi:hypothetical protein
VKKKVKAVDRIDILTSMADHFFYILVAKIHDRLTRFRLDITEKENNSE